jgi:L-fuculose-phosphate aldolase
LWGAANLFEDDVFLVTGDALLRTFDWLEVAGFRARSQVMGHTLGGQAAIGADRAEELLHRFFL